MYSLNLGNHDVGSVTRMPSLPYKLEALTNYLHMKEERRSVFGRPPSHRAITFM